MSGRIDKRKSINPNRDTITRHLTAAGIDQFGYEVMPCSRCEKRGVPCKMLEGHLKCGLCTSLGRPCDVTGTPLSSCEFLAWLCSFLRSG